MWMLHSRPTPRGGAGTGCCAARRTASGLRMWAAHEVPDTPSPWHAARRPLGTVVFACACKQGAVMPEAALANQLCCVCWYLPHPFPPRPGSLLTFSMRLSSDRSCSSTVWSELAVTCLSCQCSTYSSTPAGIGALVGASATAAARVRTCIAHGPSGASRFVGRSCSAIALMRSAMALARARSAVQAWDADEATGTPSGEPCGIQRPGHGHHRHQCCKPSTPSS